MLISVAGLKLQDWLSSSRRDLVVKPDGFQGWRELPAARREALARAVQHGEHDTPTFLPSRVVTVDFWLLAETPTELEHMADQVTAVGATGDRVRFSVQTERGVQFADGRRVSGTVDDWPTGFLETSGQLQFVFADPRKYGDTSVLPGDELVPKNPTATATSIPVFHRGTFPAHPVIEIPTAPTGYTITSPGGTFTVAGATSGGTHTVDMRTGRVYRNGVEMPGVGSGPLWAVPVGASWTHTLSVAGRVRIIDTFI